MPTNRTGPSIGTRVYVKPIGKYGTVAEVVVLYSTNAKGYRIVDDKGEPLTSDHDPAGTYLKSELDW